MGEQFSPSEGSGKNNSYLYDVINGSVGYNYSMSREEEPLNRVLYVYTTYVQPCLLWAAIAGHIAVCACLRRRLTSCSGVVYVCAMSVASIIYLLAVFITNLGGTVEKPGLCHLFTLLPAMAAFSLNLFMAALLGDQCALSSPAWKARLCSFSRACAVVLLLSVAALAVHMNLSLTVGVYEVEPGLKICSSVRHERYDLRVVAVVDCIIDHVLPAVALTCLTGVLLARRPRAPTLAKQAPIQAPGSLRMLTVLLLVNHVVLHLPKQVYKVSRPNPTPPPPTGLTG